MERSRVSQIDTRVQRQRCGMEMKMRWDDDDDYVDETENENEKKGGVMNENDFRKEKKLDVK